MRAKLPSPYFREFLSPIGIPWRLLRSFRARRSMTINLLNSPYALGFVADRVGRGAGRAFRGGLGKVLYCEAV